MTIRRSCRLFTFFTMTLEFYFPRHFPALPHFLNGKFSMDHWKFHPHHNIFFREHESSVAEKIFNR